MGRAAPRLRKTWRFLTSWFEREDAFLLGRGTWKIFEGYWPHHDAGDPVSHGINVLPKYVPSTTLKDPGWNTHVITGDVEAAVRELKAESGRELQVYGSGALIVGCSSATSSTSSTCGSFRSWWVSGFGSSRSAARRML